MFTDLRVPLGYRPQIYHAVTCSSDHLLVAVSLPSPAIAIHNWSGQQSQVITHQQLDLTRWEDIHAVFYSQISRTLHVAAGWDGVRSLRSYQVSERTASVDTRRYSHGSGNGHVLPYISLPIKASSLKFNMCNI